MASLTVNLLTKEEVEKTHRTALRILEEVGVKVEHEAICQKLRKAGAKVDEVSGIVKLPPPMVSEALQIAPREIELHSVGGKILHVGGENQYFGSVCIDPIIVDYDQGPRKPMLDDIVRNVRLADALPEICHILITHQELCDVPRHLIPLRTIAAVMRNTTKHIILCLSSADIRLWVDIAENLSLSSNLNRRSLFTVGIPITSPLKFLHGDGEILQFALSEGLPIVGEVHPSAGATAPFSLAGVNVLNVAENLFLLTMAQTLRPATPVIIQFSQVIMNMQIGRLIQYSPHTALFSWSAGEISRFYGIPTWTVGGGTQVTQFDVQNGIESMLMVFSGLTSGVHMLSAIGSNADGRGTSAEQILIDHDLVELCQRLKRGIEVNEERLAFDSIKRVGPGGNFLVDELTLNLLKSGEHYYGRGFNLSDSHSREDNMYAKAHQRVQEILSSHCPQVPESVIKEIDQFVRTEERKLSIQT